MPLLRFSLYSQNVNLYLAPTADARETWLPLMRTIASEGRAFVLSANQCMRRKNLPLWIRGDSLRHSEAKNDNSFAPPEKPARRASIVTKTEDNHEITWPSPEGKPPPNVVEDQRISHSFSPLRHSIVANDSDQNTGTPSPPPRPKAIRTLTGDNHEIALPIMKDSSVPGHASAIDDEDSEDAEAVKPLPSFGRRMSTLKRTEDNRKSAVSMPDGSSIPTDSSATNEDDDDFVSRGGSCIIGPMGEILAGPLWDIEDGGTLVVDVDFEDCERGRLDLDVAGSYSRGDAFRLTVEGLDINPPP